MPYAIVMPLMPVDNTPCPPSLGTCAEDALFALLREIAPTLTSELRRIDEREAYTIAVLRARPAANARPANILRLCLLDDAYFAPIMGGLVRKEPIVVRLGESRQTVRAVLTHHDAHPLAGFATYEELRDEAIPANRLIVRFVTPTLLRTPRREILWPDPHYLLQSWVRAWNAHADPSIALDEEALVTDVAPRLTVTRRRVETRRMLLGVGSLQGFVGDVSLDLSAADRDERLRIAALARFSFYAGTGRKTAVGMGQTRPVGRLTATVGRTDEGADDGADEE